ncbi:MAG TPA: DUF4436 family protein [Solirubrobacteraceae bacterium]|nr:DUF4436 family protein [Solirubrobacteraceae bacterium]
MSLRRVLVYVAGALVIAGAYALGLVAFTTQRDSGHKELVIDSGPNGIGVGARVIGVDPATDSATVRLEFLPLGTYAQTQVALSQAVEVFINTVNGRSDLHFAKGSAMSPTEVTLGLGGGEPLDYPFDSYRSDLLVYAQQGPKRVPVSMRVSTGFNGFRIRTSRRTFENQGYPHFQLRRATTTIFWALFVDLIFWGTALAAAVLAVRLAERQRKFEAGFTSFLAALLFAFPAVRNALPGSPPIGALNDFLAFFWTEGIVALALIGVLVAYAVRRLPGTAPPNG